MEIFTQLETGLLMWQETSSWGGWVRPGSGIFRASGSRRRPARSVGALAFSLLLQCACKSLHQCPAASSTLKPVSLPSQPLLRCSFHTLYIWCYLNFILLLQLPVVYFWWIFLHISLWTTKIDLIWLFFKYHRSCRPSRENLIQQYLVVNYLFEGTRFEDVQQLLSPGIRTGM